MSSKKYQSGYDKIKKKRKEENLIQSQKGALEKFLTKRHETSSEAIIREKNLPNSKSDKVVEAEEINIDEICDIVMVDEEGEKNLEEEEIDMDTKGDKCDFSENSTIIFYSSKWKNIDHKLGDLLVEKDPPLEIVI